MLSSESHAYLSSWRFAISLPWKPNQTPSSKPLLEGRGPQSTRIPWPCARCQAKCLALCRLRFCPIRGFPGRPTAPYSQRFLLDQGDGQCPTSPRGNLTCEFQKAMYATFAKLLSRAPSACQYIWHMLKQAAEPIGLSASNVTLAHAQSGL